MKILLMWHGILAEIAGKQEETLHDVKDTNELQKDIFTKYPRMKNMIFRVAVNQNIIERNTLLSDNDKVSFIPPFPGG